MFSVCYLMPMIRNKTTSLRIADDSVCICLSFQFLACGVLVEVFVRRKPVKYGIMDPFRNPMRRHHGNHNNLSSMNST
jgi:hypothetical protein